MRLIKPYYEILPEIKTIQDMKRNIELGGRVCYKSEDKITENSSEKFIENLIKSGHTSVLEHGTVYLKIGVLYMEDNKKTQPYEKYLNNKYSSVVVEMTSYFPIYHITTNFRVIHENGWEDDLQYWSEPTEYHEKRYSVRFVCDRGVSHEFVRHRTFSFSQESTRYCNYSKSKFNNEITFIRPNWFEHNLVENINPILPTKLLERQNDIFYEPYDEEDMNERVWIWSMLNAEYHYKYLIEQGWFAQQARSILPNSLKTELIMTGSSSQWKHFFKLRDASSAHPQARELAQPLHEEFKNLGYV